MRPILRGLGAAAFWLGLWTLAAALVGQELLLPSPLQVLRRLAELAGTALFYRTLGTSILRILLGLLAGTLLGVLLAALTESSPLAKALLAPLMALIKTTPVASFIILALIWIGRSTIPAFIAALMVLPVVWANVSAGLAGRDRQLLEMAQVFAFSRKTILRRITLPTVLPHLRAALCSALGLGWKAGIAAEVLTVPPYSIGKMIFEAKTYLETTSLFAWTLAVILLSVLIERVLLTLIRRGGRKGEYTNAGMA